MDFFEQIAREQVRAMILNNARREDLSQVFSQGEMRLLGCLHAGADGRTAGELSMLLELPGCKREILPWVRCRPSCTGFYFCRPQ